MMALFIGSFAGCTPKDQTDLRFGCGFIQQRRQRICCGCCGIAF
jgi:hypothetical protein